MASLTCTPAQAVISQKHSAAAAVTSQRPWQRSWHSPKLPLRDTHLPGAAPGWRFRSSWQPAVPPGTSSGASSAQQHWHAASHAPAHCNRCKAHMGGRQQSGQLVATNDRGPFQLLIGRATRGKCKCMLRPTWQLSLAGCCGSGQSNPPSACRIGCCPTPPKSQRLCTLSRFSRLVTSLLAAALLPAAAAAPRAAGASVAAAAPATLPPLLLLLPAVLLAFTCCWNSLVTCSSCSCWVRLVTSSACKTADPLQSELLNTLATLLPHSATSRVGTPAELPPRRWS